MTEALLRRDEEREEGRARTATAMVSGSFLSRIEWGGNPDALKRARMRARRRRTKDDERVKDWRRRMDAAYGKASSAAVMVKYW